MYDPIIFSAYSTSGNFGTGSYITGFTGFLTNVGESFKLADGTFKAPRNGIYEFSASVSHDHSSDDLAAMKNQEQVLQINLWWASTNGFNWIMELQKGDQVQLQVKAGQFTCNAGNNCIFNGKIIRDITY